MDIKKVLWPTDFSSSAEKALPLVTSLTQLYQAEIHVMYVIEDIAHHEPWYGEFDKTHTEKLMERARTSANERLDQICSKYLAGCTFYVRHVFVGDPAHEILTFMDKEKVDLVVMASRGQRGHFHFGSVEMKVNLKEQDDMESVSLEFPK
jgi:nucleotide-binding universal stress UspA family protein